MTHFNTPCLATLVACLYSNFKPSVGWLVCWLVRRWPLTFYLVPTAAQSFHSPIIMSTSSQCIGRNSGADIHGFLMMYLNDFGDLLIFHLPTPADLQFWYRGRCLKNDLMDCHWILVQTFMFPSGQIVLIVLKLQIVQSIDFNQISAKLQVTTFLSASAVICV